MGSLALSLHWQALANVGVAQDRPGLLLPLPWGPVPSLNARNDIQRPLCGGRARTGTRLVSGRLVLSTGGLSPRLLPSLFAMGSDDCLCPYGHMAREHGSTASKERPATYQKVTRNKRHTQELS